jgi:hypothetical protein
MFSGAVVWPAVAGRDVLPALKVTALNTGPGRVRDCILHLPALVPGRKIFFVHHVAASHPQPSSPTQAFIEADDDQLLCLAFMITDRETGRFRFTSCSLFIRTNPLLALIHELAESDGVASVPWHAWSRYALIIPYIQHCRISIAANTMRAVLIRDEHSIVTLDFHPRRLARPGTLPSSALLRVLASFSGATARIEPVPIFAGAPALGALQFTLAVLALPRRIADPAVSVLAQATPDGFIVYDEGAQAGRVPQRAALT